MLSFRVPWYFGDLKTGSQFRELPKKGSFEEVPVRVLAEVRAGFYMCWSAVQRKRVFEAIFLLGNAVFSNQAHNLQDTQVIQNPNP